VREERKESACAIRDKRAIVRNVRAPNDVRIDCKAAKHSDGDRGTPPADLEHRTAGGVPPRERGLL